MVLVAVNYENEIYHITRMTGCALDRHHLPPLDQVLFQPALRGGLARGLDRGRGVPLLGEEAQVALLAAVSELRLPLGS